MRICYVRTRADLEQAPLYSMLIAEAGQLSPLDSDEWAVFWINEPFCQASTDAVMEVATRHGCPPVLNAEPERDDETCHDGCDDFDAALAFLFEDSANALIKLPDDTDSPHYRLFVVEDCPWGRAQLAAAARANAS